jgi:ATP/maltotriose-dependent transcriptional regulator MalT
MSRLGKLPRPARDRRFETAQAAYGAGDFGRARELATLVVADGRASLEVVRGLAEVEYLLGDYAAAEALLRQVVAGSARNASMRVDAEAALALVSCRRTALRSATACSPTSRTRSNSRSGS